MGQIPNDQRRAMLRDFRKLHGHHPEDYKARIDCTECQVKSLTEHATIAVAASGERNAFIDKTGYSNEVKTLAKQRLEARLNG